jgi:hypothetical protein
MRSSASSEKIQSWEARLAAWFFWSTYPAQSRVDDDDLVGPGGAVDGGGDVVRFVERDDGDREPRH